MNKDERIAQLQSKLTQTVRTERLWTKGAYQELPIYRAPTELLYLNDDNRDSAPKARKPLWSWGASLIQRPALTTRHR